jgi:hypothetical protein
MKKDKTKMEKRYVERKLVDSIEVSELTSLSTYDVVAKKGYIKDASIKGFLLIIKRTDIENPDLKNSMDLSALLNQKFVLFLPQMNLDLDGTVTRTKHVGKGQFELGIEFSVDVPEYWRECLIDLLPKPGELDQDDSLRSSS